MPTVTYLSDIHLEFYNRSLPYGIDLKGYPGENKDICWNARFEL